jgi:uncharacterized protein YqjF (DUF2071 family)
MPTVDKPFLMAQWRNLAVLNFEIAPAVLAPHVPRGTELDLWQGRAFVSLVGFEFHDTKVLGCPIPWHRNFAEVNLRFYVRRQLPGEVRRGVVFLRELVRRPAVSWIARWLYRENYLTVPLCHRLESPNGDPHARYRANFTWRFAGDESRIDLVATGTGALAAPGSLDEFIIEHYWGYSGGAGRPTIEYRVDHPRWKLWPACEARFAGNAAQLYGEPFAAALNAPPLNACYADGSPVTVYRGRRLDV